MSTKTCKRCGWVYPITQPGKRCKICGEPFDVKPIVVKIPRTHCEWCGDEFTEEDRASLYPTMCLACYRTYKNMMRVEHFDRLYASLEKRFNEWLSKVHKVPKKYPTLSESQWLDACRFFNGCARCNSSDIDTRGFFISRAQGGRYCDWNIIPLCEKCATSWNLDKNMFIYTLHKDLNYNRGSNAREYRDNMERIIEYLGVRLDNAIRYSEQSVKDAE